MVRILLASILLLASPVLAAEAKRDLDAELVYKAIVGSSQEIKDLLKDGAKPDAVNSKGTPALALAAQRTDAEAQSAVEALLEGGATLDVQDAEGQSPLFHAAKLGNNAMVKLLLERGANAYLPDHSGNIARNAAYTENHPDTGKLMDEFNAKKTAEVMQAYADRDALIRKQQEEAQAAAVTVAAPPPIEEKAVPVDKVALERTVQDLAYHACGVQYWQGLVQLKTQTDLTDVQRDELLGAHMRLLEDAEKQLRDTFKADDAYISRIEKSSQMSIRKVLLKFPTNVQLREEGIGTKADASSRCHIIAAQWELSEPSSEGQTNGKSKNTMGPNQSYKTMDKLDSTGEVKDPTETGKAVKVKQTGQVKEREKKKLDISGGMKKTGTVHMQ